MNPRLSSVVIVFVVSYGDEPHTLLSRSWPRLPGQQQYKQALQQGKICCPLMLLLRYCCLSKLLIEQQSSTVTINENTNGAEIILCVIMQLPGFLVLAAAVAPRDKLRHGSGQQNHVPVQQLLARVAARYSRRETTKFINGNSPQRNSL